MSSRSHSQLPAFYLLVVALLFHLGKPTEVYSQTRGITLFHSVIHPVTSFVESDSIPLFTFRIPYTQQDSIYHTGFFLSADEIELKLGAAEVSDTLYSLDVAGGVLRLHPDLLQHWNQVGADSVYTPDLELQVRASRYQPPVIRTEKPKFARQETVTVIPDTIQPSVSQAQINQSGSITRGFTLGTNQDPYLNSALDLQISGQLTESLHLTATLTDQNLPFQADGATQTLNEFDRVYIALFSPTAQIQMGDVDLNLENGAFGVLKRRVQGGSANWVSGQSSSFRHSTGLSVQRGTFHAQILQPLTGVRGPYKLNGTNREPFITIVSGSERVYLNGELLTRGVNQDYTMDYGLAEIVFTGDRFMTTEDDILVEFQYLNREYSRTLFSASSSASNLLSGRMSISATYLREADENESLRSDLLRQRGDIPDGTLISGADSVGFQEDADYIRYTRLDTLVNGESVTIYRFIPGSTTNVWRVRFSEVGPGLGSYQRAFEAENGLLYKWTGKGTGSYEPLIPLRAPRAHQLITLHSVTKLHPNLSLQAEWAVSDVDLNRFSDLDDEDNMDQAFKIGLISESISWGPAKIRASWNTRHSGKRFEAFEQFRDVEFNTFWGTAVDLRKSGQSEWLHTLKMDADFDNNWQLRALGESILFGDYTGARGQGIIDLAGYGQMQAETSMIESGIQNKAFSRQLLEGNLQYAWSPASKSGTSKINSFSTAQHPQITITPMFLWTHEILDDRILSTGFKGSSSMNLIHLTPGIRIRLRQFEISGSYGLRDIQRAQEGVLKKESQSTIMEAGFSWSPDELAFSTRTSLGVLHQTVEPEFKPTGQDLKRIRVKTITRYGNEDKRYSGLLNLQVFSEQKPLFQEAYVYTGPEIGSFIWEDLNQDGIQQVDEFLPEIVEGEGVYSRQLIPSDRFEPVTDIYAHWQQSLLVFRAVGKRNWSLNWLSHVSLSEISTRQNPSDFYRLKWSAFQHPETTINGRIHVLQEWSARQENDRGPRLSARIEGTQSLQKRGLGVEKRDELTYLTSGEWKTGARLRWTYESGYSIRKLSHDRLSTRNLDIRGWLTSIRLQTTWNRSYQTHLGITLESKKDIYERWVVNDPPKAYRSVVRIEQRFFAFQQVEGQADIEWRYARLSGTPSIYSEYELTAGTGQGSSWVWSFRSETKLNATIRAGLKYSGRSGFTGGLRQTAEITVRALF